MTKATYTLSYAHRNETETFTASADAGVAFKTANSEDMPRIIFSDGKSARLIARTNIVGDKPEKFVPKEADEEFIAGYLRTSPTVP